MADYYENLPVEEDDKDDDVDAEVGKAAREDAELLSEGLPRVLIVSRRTLRKNKFVDFVGEYHLDLIVAYGAVPVIVPRVPGVASLLDAFEPIHGVLLCEGEDIDPELYDSQLTADLSPEEINEIRAAHASDTAIDKAKDSIELALARRCLERSIPYLGICRGSQVLNVASGGSLYQDVETEVTSRKGVDLKHIDYDNYDGHRHPIFVVPDTPLAEWFEGSLEKSREVTGENELLVNSYHHQGVRTLASRFRPMAFAPDGLIEAFFDPLVHNPPRGGFFVGLQFHPERMRTLQDGEVLPGGGTSAPHEVFEYPECPRAYQEFVAAVVAYERKVRPRVPRQMAFTAPATSIAAAAASAVAAVDAAADATDSLATGMAAVSAASTGAAAAAAAAQQGARNNVSTGGGAAAPVSGTPGAGLGSESANGRTPGAAAAAAAAAEAAQEAKEQAARQGKEREEELERRRLRIQHSFHAAKVVYEERVVLRKNATEKGGSAALAALRREQGPAIGGLGALSLGGVSVGGLPTLPEEKQELAMGASFLKELIPLSGQQVKRLSQLGGTVRNASHIKEQLERRRNQRSAARAALEALHTSELEEMVAFHKRMAASAGEVLEARRKAAGKV